MAKLKKTITLTKLYPGLNKGGPGLPISQLSQMGLNMTQINTSQLSSGTRLPWGKWRTIYYRGQRPRGFRIHTPPLLLRSTHGRGGRQQGESPSSPIPGCCWWDWFSGNGTRRSVRVLKLLLTRKLRVGSGPVAGCRVPGLALLSSPVCLQGQGDLCRGAHRPERAAWGHGRCWCWCSRCHAQLAAHSSQSV